MPLLQADWRLWRLWPQHQPPLHLHPRYVVGLLSFLICVDMIQVLGVLCYELFMGTYFPWHLYPLMLNRAVELLALLCADGRLPVVYSIGQVLLSVLSLVIYVQKQPCGRDNCIAALVLYSILLAYQVHFPRVPVKVFVAVLVVKISRAPIPDEDGDGHVIWFQDLEGQGPRNRLSPNGSMMSRDLAENQETRSFFEKGSEEIIFAVQQPDGEKFAIARLCKDNRVSPEPQSPSRFLDYMNFAAATRHGFESDRSIPPDLKEPNPERCFTSSPSFSLEETKANQTLQPEAQLDNFSDRMTGAASSSKLSAPGSWISCLKEEELLMMEILGQIDGEVERTVRESPVEAEGSNVDRTGRMDFSKNQECCMKAAKKERSTVEAFWRSEKLDHIELVKCLVEEMFLAAVHGSVS